MEKGKENIHAGHRKRLRQQFLNTGSLDSFSPHNVLELLLFYAIPRADTNALAHRLIQEFGSLRGVFDASYDALCHVDGIGENAAALLMLIAPLTRLYMVDGVSGICIVSTKDAIEYLRPYFFAQSSEILIMLCLNHAGKLLKCAKISEGTLNGVELDMKELVTTVSLTRASSVLLAHNHPGGICAPSKADGEITIRIAQVLGSIGVKFLNHIIFTDYDYFSFADHPKFSGIFQYGDAQMMTKDD